MLYREIGKTGVEASILGFGCMRLPVLDGSPDRIDYPLATEMLHYAIDHGVNYVDTAYFYHAETFGQPGQSEPFVGEALSGGWRERVNLATKMPLWFIKEYADMDRHLTLQLERLRTDHLDFYLLHGLNGATWDRMRDLGVRDFLTSARDDGRIRFPAFSFHGPAEDFPRIVRRVRRLGVRPDPVQLHGHRVPGRPRGTRVRGREGHRASWSWSRSRAASSRRTCRRPWRRCSPGRTRTGLPPSGRCATSGTSPACRCCSPA